MRPVLIFILALLVRFQAAGASLCILHYQGTVLNFRLPILFFATLIQSPSYLYKKHIDSIGNASSYYFTLQGWAINHPITTKLDSILIGTMMGTMPPRGLLNSKMDISPVLKLKQ
jgi:hypothetical protein